MLTPLMYINIDTGLIQSKSILFNNIDYGLIVDDGSGNKATYLPDVFPNENWFSIKEKIIVKSKNKEK